MAKIIPFAGYRPQQALAENVATLPYDVCSTEEARKYAENPYHFYHVTRSEIDLPQNVDVHSPEVYETAKKNIELFIKNGILVKDPCPCLYLYELEMNNRTQTGLICGSSVEDYNNNVIKKHEFTRPEKELDRINHIKATRAHTGVVFLAYRNVAEIDLIVKSWKSENTPVNDFVAEDGIKHTLWVINDNVTIRKITELFDTKVPHTYIADGHHRAASAAKVAQQINEPDNIALQHFLTCIFPENELAIWDYNRVVKDLNGLTPISFIETLNKDFEVELIGETPFKPSKPKEFGCYIAGKWYKLTCKAHIIDATDPIKVLDVSILQDHVLSKILNINDPRTDKRVDFVGGIRGMEGLMIKVDTNEAVAAFSCYPVSIQQLFSVADSGQVMPPKSTWFEPKTRDGLVVYTF